MSLRCWSVLLPPSLSRDHTRVLLTHSRNEWINHLTLIHREAGLDLWACSVCRFIVQVSWEFVWTYWVYNLPHCHSFIRHSWIRFAIACLWNVKDLSNQCKCPKEVENGSRKDDVPLGVYTGKGTCWRQANLVLIWFLTHYLTLGLLIDFPSVSCGPSPLSLCLSLYLFLSLSLSPSSLSLSLSY